MSVRIKLSKAGDRVETTELTFGQDVISVGRDAANTLPLAGSLVSKAHARIQRRGSGYCLIDLKSTNATYLNGERLVPNREYPLQKGDLVRVANFDLELLMLEESRPPDDAGEFRAERPRAGEFQPLEGESRRERTSPQADEIRPGNESGIDIRREGQAAQEGEPRRAVSPSPGGWEELGWERKEALRNPEATQAVPGPGLSNVPGNGRTPGEETPSAGGRRPEGESSLGGVPDKGGGPAGGSILTDSPEWTALKTRILKELEAFEVQQREAGRARTDLPESRERGERQGGEEFRVSGAVSFSADMQRAVQIMEVLLKLLVKLSSGRGSFLSEFMARSVFVSREGTPGRFPSAGEAIRHYADPSLPDEEFALRLKELESTADELIVHVMGLLEGYRTSIEEGARRMLRQIDPEHLGRELTQGSPGDMQSLPYRLLPVLLDVKLFHLVERRIQDLLREDRGGLERRFFRPGFIQGYEGFVASPAPEEEGRVPPVR